MNGIVAFASYKNKHPTSVCEKLGDLLLTPVPTLLQRNSFVVLKNEETGARCIYTYTNDSKCTWRIAAELVVSVVALPLALVGMLFKGLSLAISRETRDIYTNWQTPLQPEFGNPNKVQDNYFWEESRYVGLGQRETNLVNLVNFVVEKGCAPQLLHEIICHPREYMVATHDNLVGDQVRLLPYLEECSCVNSGNFNRFKNQRRTDLETQLVVDTVESFPPSEHFRLNYVGFGAGKLLQDFVNVAKLIEVGYRDLNIVLIDPLLKEYVDQQSSERGPNRALEQFKILLKVAEQKGISVQIQSFRSVTEYRQAFPDEKAHCISAIDFDDYQKAVADVALCHQVLHDNGKFYLSYDVHDLCFSSTQCIRNRRQRGQVWGYESSFQEDVEELSQKLAQKDQKVVRYAQLGPNLNFEEWTWLLPELAKCGCDKIELTLMHSCKKNYSGASSELNDQDTKESLEHYLKLFVPERTAIEVQLVESVDTFKEFAALSQAKFDVVTWSELDEEQTAKENIRWIRQHVDDGNIYYKVQAYKIDEERRPTHSFEGVWRWNAEFGTRYLLPPKSAHRAVIDELMEG